MNDSLDIKLERGDKVFIKTLQAPGYFQEMHYGRFGHRCGVSIEVQKNGRSETETQWFWCREIDTGRYPIYRYVKNQYGFNDCLDINCLYVYNPTCPICHCSVMPNRGGGMICDACDHVITIECQRDYDEGL